ncbi:MAG: hypothetical protein SGPRY_007981 [Prymnesium sp.]
MDDNEDRSMPQLSAMYWVLLTTATTIAIGSCLWLAKGRSKSVAKRARKRVLIVMSSSEFEVPCVALAYKTFTSAGLDVTLCSSTGGPSHPDAASMKKPVSEAAANRRDPAWLHVLQTSSAEISRMAQHRPSSFVAIFIAGGPRALRDLRQTDLKGHQPTPFCLSVRDFGKQVLGQGGVVGATGHGLHGLPQLSEDEKVSYADKIFSGVYDSSTNDVTAAMTHALLPVHDEDVG